MTKAVSIKQALAQYSEDDLEWSFDEFNPYKHMATLFHKPTGMEILQASDKTQTEAKASCVKELLWRLQHWTAYRKSVVRDIEDN